MLKNQTFQGAVVLIGLLIIFFSSALFQLSDHVFGPADMSQLFGLTKITNQYRPQNKLFYDPYLQMQPWLLYNRTLLREGKLPLWNPFNANGVPHLANYQSAVFSPFSVPYYVLPFKLASLLAAFSKLFFIGFFTFLFLKQLSLGLVPALLGAIAFSYSAHNVVWLTWNHAAATIVLPSSLYFAERIFSRVNVTHPQTVHPSSHFVLRSYIGFCLSLLVGLLVGHPETCYFCGLLLAAYVLFRLLTLWRQTGFHRIALFPLSKIGAGFISAGILAVGIASIQLLPFAEYLANGAQENRGAIWQSYASSRWWPLSIFPNLLGDPSDNRTLNLISRFYNYNEINAVYIGGACLFLVAVGVVFIQGNPHRKYIAFFGTVALIWLVYAGDLFGLKEAFNVIPFISQAFYGRSIPIWLFALSCCAAFAVHYMLICSIGFRARRTRSLITLLIGLVMLGVALGGAYKLATSVGMESSGAALTHIGVLVTHLAFIVATCIVAIVAATLLWHYPTPRMRLAMGVTLLMVVFLQGGYLLKEYNPVSDERFLYPMTSDIHLLTSKATGKNLLFVTTRTMLMPANTNLPYRLASVENYDAIDIKYHDQLSAEIFGTTWPGHVVSMFTEAGLKLFGVDSVVLASTGDYAEMSQPGYLQLVEKGEHFVLYDDTKGLYRYHTVSNSLAVTSDEKALEVLKLPDLDLSKTVILDVSDPSIPDLSTAEDEHNDIKVLAEEPTRVLLHIANRKLPGYLVLAKSFYPGWKARVNGVPQTVYRANYAFSAIALQPGDNDIEFYYDPLSVHLGIVLSLISVGVGILIVLGTLVWRRER